MRNRTFVAARFRALRLKRGLTQVQLAELAGVSESFIKLVERGVTQPSDPYAGALADALGCAPEDLSDPKTSSAA